jgi:hypothetical protein
VVTNITIFSKYYFHVFKLLRRPKGCWTCISIFDRLLCRYVCNSRQTFSWHKASSLCSYLQGTFALLWCKMETIVRISWISILLQGKFSLFYPSSTHFYQRKKPKSLLNIKTKNKIYLDTNFNVEEWMFNGI